MTTPSVPARVHVVAGGFPRGSAAGHDIDYARLRILQLLQDEGRATASVASDFRDIDGWLPKSDLLVTYVAGPFPDDRQCELIAAWLDGGVAFQLDDPTYESSFTVIARYAEQPTVLSGLLVGADRIAGQPAEVELAVGDGRLVLFGFRPTYRGHSVATFPFLFDALRRPDVGRLADD